MVREERGERRESELGELRLQRDEADKDDATLLPPPRQVLRTARVLL